MATSDDTPKSRVQHYDPDNLPEGIYLWKIDDDQAARLSSLLGIDFSALGIVGHFVVGEELTCVKCGKVSGLDDFVYTGLKTGAHDKAFMIRTLKSENPGGGPPHALRCCQCDTTFKERTGEEAMTAPREWGKIGWPQYAEAGKGLASYIPDALRSWAIMFNWKFSPARPYETPDAHVSWAPALDWKLSSVQPLESRDPSGTQPPSSDDTPKSRGQYDPDNLPEGIYLWKIDDDQAARLSSLLGIDFSTLGIVGHFVVGEELKCAKCGKVSGLDDFVYTGLKTGVHDKAFMIRTLKSENPGGGPPHALRCCQCDTTFKERNGEEVTDGPPGWPKSTKDGQGVWPMYAAAGKGVASFIPDALVQWATFMLDWKYVPARPVGAPDAHVSWAPKFDWKLSSVEPSGTQPQPVQDDPSKSQQEGDKGLRSWATIFGFDWKHSATDPWGTQPQPLQDESSKPAAVIQWPTNGSYMYTWALRSTDAPGTQPQPPQGDTSNPVKDGAEGIRGWPKDGAFVWTYHRGDPSIQPQPLPPGVSQDASKPQQEGGVAAAKAGDAA